MAGLLIRMRLAMLRHQSGGWWGWKTWVGLFLVFVLLGNVPSGNANTETHTSVVALLLAMWTIGMVLLALQSGAGESDLLPEYFALLPIQPRQLAFGLLAAAFVSPGSLMLALASLSLVVSGLGLAPAAVLVSVPVVALHVVFVILLVRVVVSVASMALRTRIGVELVALQWSLMISLLSVGWVLLGVVGNDEGLAAWLDGDMPGAAATLLRILPTGWGAVAVGAAADNRWWQVAVAVLALVALNVGLLGVWSRILRRQLVDRPSASASAVRWHGPLDSLRTPMHAAIWREVLRWLREPRSAIELRVAILSAAFMVVMPLAVGWPNLLPFAGAILVVMATLTASNAYGLEGTAIWLTLMTPGAERVDVRSRQWAFLLLFGPLAIAASVVLTLVSGLQWAWPWWLAFVPGGLGIAAGVMILVAVHGVVPVPEAARRSGNLMASADTSGPAYLALLLMVTLSAPALAVTGLGVRDSSVPVQVGGILIGMLIGVATFWWCGEHAIRKLEREGPEILATLRHGASSTATADDETATVSMPALAQAAVALCWTVGMIAIFPQALVPMVMKLTGQEVTAWFLPLFLPEPWQWPGIFGMLVLGGAFVVAALLLTGRYSVSGDAEPE